jgi:hypothetical protein
LKGILTGGRRRGARRQQLKDLWDSFVLGITKIRCFVRYPFLVRAV